MKAYLSVIAALLLSSSEIDEMGGKERLPLPVNLMSFAMGKTWRPEVMKVNGHVLLLSMNGNKTKFEYSTQRIKNHKQRFSLYKQMLSQTKA